MTEIKSGAVDVVIKNLSLSYDTTEVLKNVNLTIKPGELFTFLGPSGSGKSTLLRAIAGFGPFPEGNILIGGVDVTQMPPWTRTVGMVFQSYALWPHMTVRKNVAFGLEERKLPAKEIKQRVDAALNLVNLLDFGERRPSELSGGQQQRVALARTIVVEPRVLLLDEKAVMLKKQDYLPEGILILVGLYPLLTYFCFNPGRNTKVYFFIFLY